MLFWVVSLSILLVVFWAGVFRIRWMLKKRPQDYRAPGGGFNDDW